MHCVLESKECVLSRSGVHVGAQLLEVELQCSLAGETVGQFCDFLEVTLLTVTGQTLFLLLALTEPLLLLLHF